MLKNILNQEMKTIKLSNIISFLIAFSMLCYALRGKIAAIIITCYTLILLILLFSGKSRKIKKNIWNLLCSLCLLVFAVMLHFIRVLSAEYYLIIGYFAASLICLNSKIETYDSLWKYLKYISLLEAAGIYLQRIAPSIYYAVISTMLPGTVVDSIKKRLLTGYYTGFTREVSYTMFLIIIGLGIYLYDIEISYKLSKLSGTKNVKKIFAILFLGGALITSGKRATMLFWFVSIFIVQFLKSKDKLKVYKYAVYGMFSIVVIWITFPYWSRLSAMGRVVELIGYIKTNDVTGITNGRTAIYDYAMDLWSQHKYIGIGWGNFKYFTPENSWFFRFDVHNCYLQLLCENGIIGAVLFYVLLIVSIFNSIRCIIKTRKLDLKTHKLSLLTGYIQIFFLFYCITEPILYEYTDYIIFFICFNITNIILKNISHNKIIQEG